MKKPVIYKIRNVTNGKFYVGSTSNTRERFRNHRKGLRRGVHHCPHLQAAWNKYGEDCFKFEIVQDVDAAEKLWDAEAVWLNENFGKPWCYNAGRSPEAPMRGRFGKDHPSFGKKLSDEVKQNIRESTLKQWQDADPRTGKKHSEESKAKISTKVQAAIAEGRGGKFVPSEETRRKMSEALKGNQCAKGYKRTPEEIEKIRERTKGNQNWLGKKHSEESKLKMSKQVLEVTTGIQFPSLTAVLQHYGMKMPTLRRALLAGKPISRGQFMGLVFQYVDLPPAT
jgi:group I intron endonuclease